MKRELKISKSQITRLLQMELQQKAKKKELSETKAFIIATYNWLKEMKFMLIVSTRLKMAIALANQKHFINDKQYWVLPHAKTGGILVVTKKEIKYYKRKNIIDKNKGAIELSQIMFYRTPSRRYAPDALTREEKAEARRRYIRWQKLLNPIMNKAKVGAINIKRKK